MGRKRRRLIDDYEDDWEEDLAEMWNEWYYEMNCFWWEDPSR